MNSRLRYFIITLLLSVSISAVFLLSKEKQSQQKGQEEAALQANRLLELSSVAFEQMTERMATQLTRVIETELANKSADGSLLNSSFESVALVEPQGDGQLNLEWLKSSPNLRSPFDIRSWLANNTTGTLFDSEILFRSAPSVSGDPKVIFGVKLKINTEQGISERYGIGVMPSLELAGLTSSLKSNSAEIFFVDQNGFALSFPDPKYVGSKMDVHPLVSVALNSETFRNVGPFSDLSQNETIGGFKKNAQTGVTTIVNLPQRRGLAEKQSLVVVLIIVFAITAFALMLLYIFTGKDMYVVREMKEQMAKLRTHNSNLQNQSRSLDMARQAHLQWSRSVSGYLKAPIYSLIGELQKVKASDSKYSKNFEFMDKELRRVKDFIEGLGYHSDSGESLQTFNLKEKLEQVLFRQRENFNSRGLKLTISNLEEYFIYGSTSDFQAASDLLFDFFRKELLLQKTSKELTLSLSKTPGAVALTFETSLDGLPETLDEVMSLQDDRYINLAISNGLFKALSATTKIENGIEKFRFTATVPIVAAPKKEAPKAPAPTPEPAPAPKPATPDPEQLNAALQKEDTAKERLELLTKQVTAELDRVLPPSPEDDNDVTVVADLTASETSPSKADKNVESNEANDDDDDSDKPPKISIRKPRVRFDS